MRNLLTHRRLAVKAVALRTGAETVELLDVPEPEPGRGQVKIRAICGGVCGTDREIIRRRIPDVPPGEDFLILGHEGLGEIVEVNGQVDGFAVGDLVVPRVRRGCGKCNACNTGNSDYCFTGDYTERGIHKVHGFLCEYFVDDPQYLVKVDNDIADVAVLAEPMSVSVKAAEIALTLARRVKFDGWYSQPGKPEKALVAGHGPIGMLGTMLLSVLGFDVHVMGRRDKGDFQRDLVERSGIEYFDHRHNEVDEHIAEQGQFFLIFEATGLSEITFDLANYLGRNGTMVLTGVPRGPNEMSIDGNRFMAQVVRTNQVIVGSVNACRGCFEQGLKYLQRFKKDFPEIMDNIFTSRFPAEQCREALAGRKDPKEIKTLIEF
jgi:threonine dehydrogenase-like Zn-dependent dehydrogenase